MKRTEPPRLILWLIACAVVAISAMIPHQAAAFTYEFHGFLESSVIARDETGFQNGFLDDMALVSNETP